MSPHRVSHRVAAATVSWLAVATLVRVVVAMPEQCPLVDADRVLGAADEAVGWLTRNQNDDGTWLYRYDADIDEVIDDYNTVRHAGVVMSLYQAASFEVEGALEVADAGTTYAVDNLVRHDDWVAFEPRSNRVTTGASALLVAGLVERRLHTGDERHDELLRGLSRFLLVHVEESGAVIESWNREREEPLAGVYSPFFTGEVYWALALMHLVFPDDGWDEPATRIVRYLATERDEVEGYFPDVPDHWAAYGMSVETMWREAAGSARPLSEEQVAYAERQAAFGGLQARWESQRQDSFPRYLLRGRRTLGAGLGTVGELLTSLWRVAGADARLEHLANPIAERARCVAGMLAERQMTADEAAVFARPDRVQGAWLQFGITQMDDQQHALSALLLTLEILDVEGGEP